MSSRPETQARWRGVAPFWEMSERGNQSWDRTLF